MPSFTKWLSSVFSMPLSFDMNKFSKQSESKSFIRGKKKKITKKKRTPTRIIQISIIVYPLDSSQDDATR